MSNLADWLDGQSISDALRSGLIREGIKAVRISPNLEGTYWDPKHVEEMIKYLERKLILCASGIDELNPLENMALIILLSSAGIPLPKKQKERKYDRTRS